jgi:FkbM family methyltransferase
LKIKKKVEILEAAVGNKTISNRKFYLSKNWHENSLHRSLIVEKVGQSEITVRMVTLEDIFSLYHLEKIDLLKVDIEGEEWNLFEKFSKHDFERIYQISVEFHDFLDPSLRRRTERSIKILKELGYSFIYAGTGYMYGTPFFNCLFYNKKRLDWTTLAKWMTIPKQMTDRL